MPSISIERRRHEGAVRASRRGSAAWCTAWPVARMRLDVVDRGAAVRLGVDHRADVGRTAGRGCRRRARPSRPRASRITRSAMSSCRQSTRSAEQRWPALSKAEASDVAHDLLGQRRGIDDHRVLPAGLGDQRIGRPPSGRSRPASCRLIELRDLGRAGEHHAGDRSDRRPARAAGLAVARQQLQHAARHAGLVQQAHGLRGDQRRLLGRLGEHRVAGRQRRRDLAGEDRQREVPRADADDRARAAGACRCRSRRACSRRSSAGSRPPRAPRRRRWRSVLPASRTIRPSSGSSSRLHQVGGALAGSRRARRRRSPASGARPARQRRVDLLRRSASTHRADDVAVVGRD